MSRSLFLPRKYTVNSSIRNISIQQIGIPDEKIDIDFLEIDDNLNGAVVDRVNGSRVLITNKRRSIPDGIDEVLLTHEGAIPSSFEEAKQFRARWQEQINLSEPSSDLALSVLQSWAGNFNIKEEELEQDGSIREKGLRPPQVGALYAALAHWKVSNEPATIVMPTGTGKTETMLSLLVHQKITKLLVVVPNLALRSQIAEKFLSLGLLKQIGIIGASAQFPIVTTLTKRLQNLEEVENLIAPANVIVTNIQVLEGCSDAALSMMADLCTHVFFDEAHHLPARTWTEISKVFGEKSILQFTATPFRNDGKQIEGKIIFNYPLKKAQAEQYFRPIKFDPVIEDDPEQADKAIATKAIEVLRNDVNAGLDHLLMVRVQRTLDADRLLEVYQEFAEFNPVVIHSNLSNTHCNENLIKIKRRQSRIVICANMFGEGFDMPELKIAALHSVHKSLAVTLQFVGRFTRFRRDLGDATIIANIADINVRQDLQDLYAEGADWNHLLREVSAGATGARLRLSNFISGFNRVPNLLSLQNITPKMSTVIYHTSCSNWTPHRLTDFFGENNLIEPALINQTEKVAICVVRSRNQIEWARVKDLVNIEWNIYIIHWDQRRNLLFINSSVGHTFHEKLAKEIAGSSVERIRGEKVYRVLHGINHLTLTNLGLNHVVGRAVSFSMLAGSNILQVLTDSQQENKVKSNIFGLGYLNGDYITIGTSSKGRFWSFKVAIDVPEWVDWCQVIGTKILDNNISLNQILRKVVKYQDQFSRPNAIPIMVDWSDNIISKPEKLIHFSINNGEDTPLYLVGLQLLTFDLISPIKVKIFNSSEESILEIGFNGSKIEYRYLQGTIKVKLGSQEIDFLEWLVDEPLTLRFHDRSFIKDNLFGKLSDVEQPFDPTRIIGWDWGTINIQSESQGLQRDPNTVQNYTIIKLLNEDYDVIFDDDSSYEAADILTFKFRDDVLFIELYHCKFSGAATAGGRVKDLYEVCGQVQKSVQWNSKVSKLFDHLKLREKDRINKHGVSTSRFQKGDLRTLGQLERKSRLSPVEFKIFAVQPGVSQSSVTTDQLKLLAATELYLKETSVIPFEIIGSN